ncbi:MAG: hypothetical protein AB1758_28380 [Candidatus Eremiobacterota bacterium]
MSQALHEKRMDVLAGGNRRGQGQRYQRYLGRVARRPVETSEEEEARTPVNWVQVLGEMELADRIRAIWITSLGLEAPTAPPMASTPSLDEEPVWTLPPQFRAPSPGVSGQRIDSATIDLNRMNGVLSPVPQETQPSSNVFAGDLPMLRLQAMSPAGLMPHRT